MEGSTEKLSTSQSNPSGDYRGVRRFTSVQHPTMPKLVEESEDTSVAADHGHQLRHIQSCPQLKMASNSQPLSANNVQAKTLTANNIQSKQHNHYNRLNSLGTSQLSKRVLPEICEDSMVPPTTTTTITTSSMETSNHLLGVPNHFLSSAGSTGSAPDLTQSSGELQSQHSPDLLRVETAVSRSENMPPLPSEPNQNKASVTESAIVSEGKLETADCSEMVVAQPHRIYGRFSPADETMVREKKAEELESKFVFLTSGLNTQKETLDRRLKLSMHTRTSTEESLTNEINSLLDEIRGLVAKDRDGLFKADLRNIEKRLQKVMPMAIKLGSKAETYGAAKQEQKQLNSAESMVEYVEHLKRVHTRETNDHHATRVKLLKAKQEGNFGDGGDSSVNVNITRRASTMGGQTQTRRASVSITALPNILGGQGFKQLSVDPRSKFQQLVRKSSLSNVLRRTSQDSNCSDYTELPAVTVSRPSDSPAAPLSPETPMRPRHSSFSFGDRHPLEPNNNGTAADGNSHVAVIKTLCAVTPSVEMVEKPEKGEVRAAIRRRRSIKRSDTSSSRGNSIDIPLRKAEHRTEFTILTEAVDKKLSKLKMYRLCKEKYHSFNSRYPKWRRQLLQALMILTLFAVYLQINVLLST